MSVTVVEKSGVVAEKDGLYWGVEYEDSYATSRGFGPIQHAEVSDPRYCHKPEDMVWVGNTRDREALSGARLVAVTITTSYAVSD